MDFRVSALQRGIIMSKLKGLTPAGIICDESGIIYKQITVLVDVDNVLEDLDTPWVKAVNDKYGTNVKVSDITNWNIAYQ